MSNIIPEILEDLRIYLNGSTDLRGVADVQLPSFEPLSETVSGAGILGEYETSTPGQFSSLKTTINWRMVTSNLIEFLKPVPIQLECRMANKELDSGSGTQKYSAVRISMLGRPGKNDLGTAKKMGTYDASTEIEILYILIEIDGKVLVELDKPNYKYVVDGVDYMAEVKAALGL